MEMKKQKKLHNKLIKLFELQDFLQVIDRDVNGNAIKIGNPAFSTLNSTRIAENENDFEDIYNRELKTVGSDIINISSYITKCKKRVNDMVEVYEKICEEGNHKEDDKLLDTAVSYVIFLDRKISPQQNSVVSVTVPTSENSLNWNGTQTEFIELVKALIENGNIKGTQTEIISKLSNVFNIKISYPNKLITDLKVRNNGSETLFLDKLKKSLFDYITIEK